jgi:hypothetical protein
MHRLVLPVDEAASCPATCIFPLSPGCVSRLPRTPLPFSWAGVRILRLPLGFGPSAAPAMDVRVAPNFTCLRRCWFQQGSEFPRWLPLPPAAPPMKDLGFPSSCISGFTGDGLSSRPDSRIFRRCRLGGSRVAPSPSRSVSPTIRCSSCPVLRILRHRLMGIRVTSDHTPSGLLWLDLRVAPNIFPWLRQSTNFQVALNLGSLTVRRFTAFRVAPNLGSSADLYLLPRVAPFWHLQLSR